MLIFNNPCPKSSRIVSGLLSSSTTSLSVPLVMMNCMRVRIDIALDLCIKFNVTLKMGKTWLGFPEVKFFGYMCRKGSYELATERKEALGFALFFKPFVSQYSILAAPLNDMVHKDFNWTWKVDYRAV